MTKMRMSGRTTIFAVLAASVTGSAQASFLLAGSTFDTNAGFPWVGDTNYRYSITSNGTNGVRNQANSAAPSLGIGGSEWLDASSRTLTLRGSVSGLPSNGSSYLQIGIITRAQAQRAEASWGYASYMFNNAVGMTFNPGSAGLFDTAAIAQQVASGLAGTIDYEMSIDVSTMTIMGRLSTDGGSTWSATQSLGFGVDNWSSLGFNNETAADFSQVAVLAQFYNEGPNGAASSVTFGDISASFATAAVPLPGAAGLAGLAFAGLTGRSRRRR